MLDLAHPFAQSKALLNLSQALLHYRGTPHHQAMLSNAQDLCTRFNLAFPTDGPTKDVDIAAACKVTPQAVSGWRDTGRIAKRHLLILARLSGRPVEWWLGEELGLASNVEQVSPLYAADQVPELSWVQAGQLCDSGHPPLRNDEVEHWHPCPVPYKRELFALRVVGDSMDDGANGYRDGELIFVDPTLDAHHNSDIIVITPDGRTTFKRLQIAPEGRYLVALNPAYPERVAKVPEGTRICGVIVFSGKRRR